MTADEADEIAVEANSFVVLVARANHYNEGSMVAVQNDLTGKAYTVDTVEQWEALKERLFGHGEP